MAKVILNLLNIFYLMTKEKAIQYEGKTIKDVISQFLNQYGAKLNPQLINNKKKNKLNEQILILLNGRDIKYLNEYKTELNDGDNIYLSVPLAGG